jgi:hypothetical protein
MIADMPTRAEPDRAARAAIGSAAVETETVADIEVLADAEAP